MRRCVLVCLLSRCVAVFSCVSMSKNACACQANPYNLCLRRSGRSNNAAGFFCLCVCFCYYSHCYHWLYCETTSMHTEVRNGHAVWRERNCQMWLKVEDTALFCQNKGRSCFILEGLAIWILSSCKLWLSWNKTTQIFGIYESVILSFFCKRVILSFWQRLTRLKKLSGFNFRLFLIKHCGEAES